MNFSNSHIDFLDFVAPYLSGTQLLVSMYRALGANIGKDVILPDPMCITDPHLVCIGDHVRLNSNAFIVAHTFERRILKLAPIVIGDSSVLMSYTLVQSGSKVYGQNHIFPWTLIMRDDRLPRQTKWTGVPARQTN